MNRLGIALAADSAVAIGETESKIYTSADKLFLLAENAPVGIMVYGNAKFLGVPWETIIKIYRRQLKGKTFPTLPEYANSLVEYLQTERVLFTETAQEEFVMSRALQFLLYLREELRTRLEKELESRELTDEDIGRVFAQLVDDELAYTKQFPDLDDLPADFISALSEQYAGVLSTTKERVLGSLPMEGTTNDTLTNLILELSKRRRFLGLGSGVVVAGFGEAEHFPSLLQLELQGLAANRLLFSRGQDAKIGDHADAYIAPFAQQEMVASFHTALG